MAAIPSVNVPIREVICPEVASKDRYTGKYAKPGFEWCDSEDPQTCRDPSYTITDKSRIREQDEGCGCRPGLVCGWGGGKWRSKWSTQKCLAKEGVYPSDDATKLKCCSGANKAIDCHPSYCSGSNQCRDFMKNYCLGENSKYFEKRCQDWVTGNYANREDILLWASNACEKMLNENTNITTATNDDLIDWCKISAKANPRHFDQVFDKYCLNKEQQYETSICACYGGTDIPGATQLVPNACLGDCGLYGYKNNKMLETSCTIAMCNTVVNLTDVKDSEVELGTLKNACSAQVGGAIIEKTSDYAKQEGGMNPLITEKSMLPEQILNIAKQLGLDELAKRMNINLDVFVVMIIVVAITLLLSLSENKERSNFPASYRYQPPMSNYYYR